MPELLSPVREFPLFESLPPETAMRLGHLLNFVHFAAGDTVFSFGDSGATMYFLCSGQVQFVTTDDTGHEIVLQVIGAGEFFGEVAVLGEEAGSRTATAIVTKDARALELHHDNLLSLFQECPDAAKLLLQGMAMRLRHSGDRLRHTITNVHMVLEQDRKALDKVIHKSVQKVTSPIFLGLNACYLVVWIAVALWQGQGQISDRSLGVLGLVLAIESLIVSLLVLTSSDRDAKDQRIRDDHERQTNLNAEQEIRALHQKLDRLHTHLQQRVP